MIKAIILDVDGVILKGEMFSKQYEKEFGVSARRLLPFFNGTFQECLVGKADLKKELEPYLKEWRWEKSADEFLDYWFKTEHQIDEELIVYIKELKQKGIKCYVATNQEKYRTEYIIKEMKFKNIFDNIFSSANLGYKKPEKRFFEEILKELNDFEKKEIIFWDNSKTHVDSAKEVGLIAEVYLNLSQFKYRMNHYLSNESVDIVNNDSQILYSASKREAHEKGLLHKTVIAEIINSKGEMMLIQPYSHKQDAGQYVSPVGGHVSAGESDEEALKREVKEEVGIEDFKFKLKGRGIFNRQVLGRLENHYFIVYEINTDEKPELGDEAESYRYFKKEELKTMLKENRKNFGDAFLFLVDNLYPELKT